MKALPIQFDESIPAWEKAIYAFLAEKEWRSGSMRTVDANRRSVRRSRHRRSNLTNQEFAKHNVQVWHTKLHL